MAKRPEDLTGKDKLAFEKSKDFFEQLTWDELAKVALEHNQAGTVTGQATIMLQKALTEHYGMSTEQVALMLICAGCGMGSANKHMQEMIKNQAQNN